MDSALEEAKAPEPVPSAPEAEEEDEFAPPAADEELEMDNNEFLNGNLEDDDDNNNEELTPPPDTPEDASNASSHPAIGLEDEIVVGTNANHKSSPPRPPSDQDDDMDVDDNEDEQPPIAQPVSKRKRPSTYNEDSEKIEDVTAISTEPTPRPRIGRPPNKTSGLGGVKGVVLGYWRDSAVEDPLDKHSVIGFMDARDRLRTRVQATTRDGRNVSSQFPIPPGPGGSWVTFDKIVFDDPLVNLDHHQVKEFVKIRAENPFRDETPEQKAQADEDAVKEAIRRVQENPPPESNVAVLIAYGAVIPEHAQIPHRPDTKRRKLAALAASMQEASPTPLPVSALDNIPGTRPTRILLGYWRLSSEPRVEDKHAVYGILGANDMFRVKLMRETRDGRPVQGNFPMGPGALWIHWDEVEFELHLKNLPRAEIKEYCRVRQRQLDDGESHDERISNETKAVFEAQHRVANMASLSKRGEDMLPMQPLAAKKESPATNGNGPDDDYNDGVPPDLRQSRRNEHAPRARHSLPGQGSDALERTNSIAQREVARLEAAQQRADQRATTREGSVASNRTMFQDNVSRLNKIWAAQEANRLKAGTEDAKIYLDVKYERKKTGPFAGKLVSQGTIITIDGEDYVEYRVLTKPTF